jgi:hypothetical protein
MAVVVESAEVEMTELAIFLAPPRV